MVLSSVIEVKGLARSFDNIPFCANCELLTIYSGKIKSVRIVCANKGSCGYISPIDVMPISWICVMFDQK